MAQLVKQYWEESEAGWGQRPDGYTLHLTEQDRKDYVREYWDKQPKGPTPTFYFRPSGTPVTVNISKYSPKYKQVANSKNGAHFDDE